MEAARQNLLEHVRRAPFLYGFDQSRWTLKAIAASGSVFKSRPSIGGLHGMLQQLHICWKRGRSYIHSPDQRYAMKKAEIERVLAIVRNDPMRFVLLYLDEVTLERQPTLANAWESTGSSTQPLIRRDTRSNTPTRYIASMNALTGQVQFRRSTHIRLATIVEHHKQLRLAYPDAETIYVVQDNWPVHVHPDVLCALQPQIYESLFIRPGNWPTEPSAAALRKWNKLLLPIQLLPLPTYASWLNPIEKLWRWMRQTLGHHHQYAHDIALLRLQADQFLARFSGPSSDLLQYVGLSSD